MHNFIEYMKKLFKVEFIVPISIICSTIIVILIIIIKSGRNLKTKIFTFGKNEDEKINIRHLFIVEKMETCKLDQKLL